jgi:peptidoglycan-N-acetylmuramic acid deacetylase
VESISKSICTVFRHLQTIYQNHYKAFPYFLQLLLLPCKAHFTYTNHTPPDFCINSVKKSIKVYQKFVEFFCNLCYHYFMEVILLKLYSMTGTAILVLGAGAALALSGNITSDAQSGAELAKMAATTTTTTETTTEATTIVKYDTSKLSNTKRGWYFNPNNEHKTPTVQGGIDYKKYDAYYVGDTSQKIIYLTFDEGYENGYTAKILDVLKAKNVHAAFFVTKDYIEKNTELVKRMRDEGHIVGNHSMRHLSSPSLSDAELFSEINETAWTYKKLIGTDMVKVFRPPMGEYSERTLAVAHNMGYKTIFWSFAHRDWETNNQPGKTATYNTVMQRYHNGSIMLLHAVSSSNTEALPEIIDSFREKGYSFGTLDQLQ